MKKKLLMLTLAVIALLFTASCSKDDNSGNGTNGGEENTTPQCWALYDGNFLTDEDVVISPDTDNVEVSRTMFTHTFGNKEMKKGDVIGLYKNGILMYLHITKLDNSGSTYVSCDVEEIDLQKTLEICNIDMGNVRLSTEFYMDPNQPKRVNNSGEEDATGIINTKCYTETASDGTTIYHPMAMATPAYYNGENGTTDGQAVPGGYVGCYIGQLDQDMDANSWGSFFNSIGNGLKKVGKAIIAPVEKAVKVVTGTGELIKTLALGGKYTIKANVVDIDQTFNDETFTFELDPNGKDEPYKKEEGMWTEEKWEGTVKGKAQVTLDGKLKAEAGAYMDLELKGGCNLQQFKTGVQANADVDLNTEIALGVEGNLERPVVLHKFDYKTLTFNIGPIPIIIVIYPELIWKSNLTGEIYSYVTLTTKYQMNYDAHIEVVPQLKATAGGKTPVAEFYAQEFGVKGSGELKSGIYFRTSWELYGGAGPVFDFGASISAECEGKIYAERDEDAEGGYKCDAKGHFGIYGNIGDSQASFAVKFPPLKDKCKWLYEKLSWESGDLMDIDPIWKIPIWERGDTEDEEEDK